jgi:hypothetical protein
VHQDTLARGGFGNLIALPLISSRSFQPILGKELDAVLDAVLRVMAGKSVCLPLRATLSQFSV